jgi:hypothetical protein
MCRWLRLPAKEMPPAQSEWFPQQFQLLECSHLLLRESSSGECFLPIEILSVGENLSST